MSKTSFGMWKYQEEQDLIGFCRKEVLLLMLKIFFQLEKLTQCIHKLQLSQKPKILKSFKNSERKITSTAFSSNQHTRDQIDLQKLNWEKSNPASVEMKFIHSEYLIDNPKYTSINQKKEDEKKEARRKAGLVETF